MSRRLVFIVTVSLLSGSCREGTAPPPIVVRYAGVNEDTEEIINGRLREVQGYSFSPDGRCKTLVRGGRAYQFQRIPDPGYRGGDDVLTLALSTHTADSRPTAGLYFVDLYWFKTFRPEWLVPFEGTEWSADQFEPGFIKVCYLGDGAERRLYAIPFSAKGNVLFYRRDLLKLLGDEKPPETWPDLIRQVRSLAAKSGGEPALAKVKYGLVFHWVRLVNDFYPILWGYGGDIFSEDERRRERAADAILMLRDLVHDTSRQRIRLAPSVEELQGGFHQEGQKLHTYFAQGEAIFMINWDNRLDKMRKCPGATVAPQQVGVAPIPHLPGEVSASNIGSWGWVISRRPEWEDRWTRGEEVVAVIQEFVHDLTSAEAQEWLAANHGYIPSRRIALSEKSRKKIEALGPGATEAFALFADGQRVRFVDRPHNKRVNDIVERALMDAILAPREDAEAERRMARDALDEARRRAQVFLSE